MRKVCVGEHYDLLVQDDFIACRFTQTYDTVYCSLTLFQFKDKRAFIDKTAKLLLPGGRAVLSFSKEKETSIKFDLRQVELYPDDLDTLKVLLLDASFVILDTFDVEFAHIIVAEKT